MTGGCAATAAKTPTAGSTVATGSAATAGGVHLTDYADNDGPTSTVILAGAIGDYGRAQSVKPDGTIDPEHSSELDLRLSQGSFRLKIAELDKKFVGAMNQLRPATGACSGTAAVSAAAPIVAGSGTGSYKAISGTFNLTMTLDEVYAKSNCTESGSFLAEAIVVTGSGTVALH